MTGRSTRRPVTELDPLFNIPVGMDELAYAENPFIDAVDAAENEPSVVEDFDSTDDGLGADDTNYDSTPEVPQILDVYHQDIRTDSTGMQVIDVVFDVSDISGATSYELRISPA